MSNDYYVNSKKTVLTLLWNPKEDQILMIFKKRGMGSGKWNFPGGKLLENEDPICGAIRETQEETGLTPKHLQLLGRLDLLFPKDSKSWNNCCHIFVSEAFE